jgi:hypothetical protein
MFLGGGDRRTETPAAHGLEELFSAVLERFLQKRNQEKCFQGEKGAAAPIFCPQFFSTDLKRGRESLSPPKYLDPQQKFIANLPQFAAIC